MAAAPKRWVILGRVAVLGDENPGADFSLVLAAPPRVTNITVAERVHPQRRLLDTSPYLLAEDIAGLLFHFSVGPCHGLQFGDFPDSSHLIVASRPFLPVGPVSTGAATRVPDRIHPMRSIANIGNVGLMAVRGNNYIIAEFQPSEEYPIASILRFRSGTNGWTETVVIYPNVAWGRKWAPNGVISFFGRLWWVDLSWGLMTCDPSADYPMLDYIALPPGSILPEATPDIDDNRCVRVSCYRLMFVAIFRSPDGVAMVRTWRLVMGLFGVPLTLSQWKKQHEARFADIWGSESYSATHLPEEIPKLALVDPWDPEVVYFSLRQRLFGVNVRESRVVVFVHEAYELAELPFERLASCRYVLAWGMPPYFSQEPTPAVASGQSVASAPAPL